MKFIKSHKNLFIIIGIVLVVALAAIIIYIKFSPDSKKDLYGNRLTDIEKYQIEESRMKDMIARADEIEGIESVSYNIKGRLVNIIVKCSRDLPQEQAMEYANVTLEYFTEEEKAYYDIQIFLIADKKVCDDENCEEEIEIYPIIGYKHKTTGTYVWKQE